LKREPQKGGSHRLPGIIACRPLGGARHRAILSLALEGRSPW
jgi:hypothetical protein